MSLPARSALAAKSASCSCNSDRLVFTAAVAITEPASASLSLFARFCISDSNLDRPLAAKSLSALSSSLDATFVPPPRTECSETMSPSLVMTVISGSISRALSASSRFVAT